MIIIFGGLNVLSPKGPKTLFSNLIIVVVGTNMIIEQRIINLNFKYEQIVYYLISENNGGGVSNEQIELNILVETFRNN